MGTRGTIPKREEERRRRNKTDENGQSNQAEKLVVDPTDLADPNRVGVPDPDPGWHTLAMMVYESVKISAVSLLYEPSDWAVLFVTLDQLSRNLQPQPIVVQSGPRAGEVVMVDVPMNGSTLAGITKVFTTLMLTEGDRRRLRLEVERVNGSRTKKGQAPTGDNVLQFRANRLG